MELLEQRMMLAADLSLSVQLNGQSVATAPGPQLLTGDAITWNYAVTNTGDVPLQPPTISDNHGTPAVLADDIVPLPVSSASTARGTLEGQIAVAGAANFLQHPTQPYIYASVFANNTIVILNANTLALEAEIPIGSAPRGIALSPDGSRLYVALSTTRSIAVFDTQSRAVLPSLMISQRPWDIEVAADGHLYVAGDATVLKIDPLTGSSVGPSLGGTAGGGELAMSPQKDRLYYSQFGYTPSTLMKWNITTSPPTSMSVYNESTNGYDLALSADGQYLSFATGSGQSLYKMAKFRTSDMAIMGQIDAPRYVTYSADNSLLFTAHESFFETGVIRVWDANTFLQLSTISTPGSAIGAMQVDRSGARLYVGTSTGIYVFSTGLASIFNAGDVDRDGVLDVGEAWQYRAMEVATPGQQSRTIAASATTSTGVPTAKSAPANFGVAGWKVALQAKVQGSAAESSPGVSAGIGQPIAREVIVANPGQYPLSNVVVKDDLGTTALADDMTLVRTSGDTNGNGRLDTNETWRYTYALPALAGAHQHEVSVTALPVGAAGEPLAGAVTISAEDSNWYTGINASLQVEARIDGLAADAPPGAAYFPGESLNLTYEVTNTGTSALGAVQLSDDRGTAGSGDDLRPIESSVPVTDARGALMRTFNFAGNKYLLHPTLPYLFAAVPTTNSIAIINTDTLQLETTLFVGSGPRGMALSADGSRLYVANSLSYFVAVVDVASRSVIGRVQLTDFPRDVEVGADGRLYVMIKDRVLQIDPLTSQEIGPFFGGIPSAGEIAINPQKDRLYVADYGSSPAQVMQYNVAVNPPALIRTVQDDASNGLDLALNDDGTYLSYAAGSGQFRAGVARYRTSDMSIVGQFGNTSARAVTFSHDDAFAYTLNGYPSSVLHVWSTSTYTSQGTITLPTSAVVHELIIDRQDRYAFITTDNQILVYATGRGRGANAGDANANHLLDPGETWVYVATESAITGLHTRTTTVTAMGPGNAIIVASDPANYQGLPILRVIENPGQEHLATVEASGVQLTVSDARFEIAGTTLRLKAGAQLNAAADTGLVLDIRTVDNPPVVVQRFKLEVVGDATPWHNDARPFDINNDGHIAPLDSLLIIIELNARGPRTLVSQWVSDSPNFFDVNSDGQLAPLDALLVIIHLNAVGVSEGEAPPQDALFTDLGSSHPPPGFLDYLDWNVPTRSNNIQSRPQNEEE